MPTAAQTLSQQKPGQSQAFRLLLRRRVKVRWSSEVLESTMLRPSRVSTVSQA